MLVLPSQANEKEVLLFDWGCPAELGEMEDGDDDWFWELR
jgi:hypothetical protein